ncbi:MAG: hypothetical protein V7606_4008 [Burkholderiales bacterium]
MGRQPADLAYRTTLVARHFLGRTRDDRLPRVGLSNGHFSWRAEFRVLACIMLFWIVEDFLWFVLNSAYGLARFDAASISWHKRWLWFAPLDYWVYALVLIVLLRTSYATMKEERGQG